jgi:hypothetical protein
MRNTLPAIVFCLVAAASASAEPWKVDVLMESEHVMGGAAIGDLDPSTPGAEVAVVNDAAEALLVRRADGKWQPEQIYAGKGEMIMCAIGDVDPRHPGNEFVGVGMVEGAESSREPGQAVLVWKDGERWSSRVIFQDTHLLHGVAIGDVSAAHPGNEVVVCGFNHRVQLLYLEEGSWKHETIYVANDRLKIVLADVDPNVAGAEAYVCGYSGRVTQFVRATDDYWKSHVVHVEERPLHHLLAGEFDSGHDGVELLTCGHGGRLIAVYPTGQAQR